MPRLPLLILVAAMAHLAGCQGQYTFTIPEQVAPAGASAIVVARLQKSEFAMISPPAKNMCVRFTIEDGPLSAAYTDDRGYAAVNVQVPQAPGRYHVVAEIMDKDGREASAFSPVYVLDKRPPCVAIDLACLEGLDKNELAQAQQALAGIAQKANIIYFTDSPAGQAFRHERLKAAGFPDGAILQWQRQFWHTTKQGSINMLIAEDRMVSQLPILRQMLPNLRLGITNSCLPAQAFTKADMRCIAVGKPDFFQQMPAGIQRMNWQQVAQQWQVSRRKPATQMASQPASQPTTEPATQSANESETQPAMPMTQPATQPATPAADESETQPAVEIETQPATQPAAEPVIEIATQPAMPMTQPASEPTALETQPATQPAVEIETQPATQPTSEPVIEIATQPAAEPTSQPATPATQPSADGQ
jgi:hypothetical protein